MTTWHAPAELLARYHAGALPPAHQSSVEAHVLACGACRTELATVVTATDGHRLEALWDGVVDAVDAPAAGIVERALRRVGVAHHVARLLAATPSLQVSWLLAVAAALAFAVAAARGGDGDKGLFLFLLIAPLLPVAGTAVAFGPRFEPAYEIGVAAPLQGFTLLLVRSAAVLASTTVMAGVAAAALPGAGWEVGAWVLPALALTTGTLVLATWLSPVTSATVLAGLWFAGTILSVRGGSLRAAGLVERAAAFSAAGQLLFAVITVVALAVLFRRRETLELGRLA